MCGSRERVGARAQMSSANVSVDEARVRALLTCVCCSRCLIQYHGVESMYTPCGFLELLGGSAARHVPREGHLLRGYAHGAALATS